MSWVKSAVLVKPNSADMEEVVKQLIQANLQLQKANANQQETNANQQETNRLLIETTQAVHREQQSINKSLVEQIKVLAERPQVQEGSISAGRRVQASLQKMVAEDDVETYLTVFERTAEREKLPAEQWADILAPFLSGEPQKAYFDLSEQDARQYHKLKAEILARLGVTSAVRAQLVHNWTFQLDKPARSQMYDLFHLAKKWLQPEEYTAAQVVERVVLDRFVRALPVRIQRCVGQADPRDADQLVALVERYLNTEEYLQDLSPARPAPRSQKTADRGKTVPDLKGAREGRKVGTETDLLARPLKPVSPKQPGAVKNIVCWRCQGLGHVAANCPLIDEPMDCDSGRRRSMFAGPAYSALPTPDTERQTCSLVIEGHSVQALLDSGSLVTLVHGSLVDTRKLQKRQMGVICIHGDIKEYPTAIVSFETPCGKVTHEVGVVNSLMHTVIVGCDFPLFWQMWNMLDNCLSGSAIDPMPLAEPVNVQTVGVTQSEPEGFPLAVLAGDTDEVPEVGLPDLPVSSDNFGTAQLRDPTLTHAQQSVKVVNGVSQEPGVEKIFPHFALENDLLYRVDQKNGQVVEQLVVPKSYRQKVMDLAHSHVLGGHLAYEKTKDRVLQRFYWPGVHKEVKEYCDSCPVCQLRNPVATFRSPLVPLPIIETPFERIAMDLVGPLVKSARGHQYILVVLDYATRYPEAIPLRKTSAKVIAKELFQMFTRVGIPKEILTDQGTPFMSKVTKELCKLLKITHLRTSVYHPQTDGLVERFNKTLKGMLRKVVAQDGKDWDCLLPYLMFSVREVPQASTGFSPFELVYGRHPRGLLDIAKETWESEATPYKSVIEHVAQMQERIEKVMPIVKEHLLQAQESQSRVYNRSARVRNFSPGDRVLVLVPTVESKFLAKWQGPYEIVEKVGEVNYRVHQPGRRKPYQIYHVNLIKPWKDREVLAANSSGKKGGSTEIPEVKIADTLSGSQTQEAKEFVQENRDVFSELPGRTDIIKHDVVTEPGVRVNQKPYRIPEARRKAVSQEVQTMLQLGVIEESNSDWCSPIVLVPKPDGTIRFCNDFRKLNMVSKFDAYPMPRVDELIDRLGNARFFTTLDLTKGYWQVPLTEGAKEKTAFSVPDGHFQYVVLPFGLHGAPATFQRMMDKILRPHRKYAAAYLDDVIIHSTDWESHLPRVQAVLNSIREAGLTANPKKCAIGQEEARYLGYTIGRGVIKPQINKVEAIQNWPRPLNKKQVKAFLGLTGYYRRFIENFASIASPLTDLTKGKDSTMVKWTPEAEQAFQNLKQALCAQPVLVTPDFKKEFIVQTDASDVGIGAVLSQVRDGEEHPVVYLSKKLNEHEKKYSIVEKECFAIKWAVEALRYYLVGRTFKLVTDHAPLKWMCQNREKNRRVTRWFMSLQDYSFTVEHRPGRQLGNADALSRVYCLRAQCVPTPRSKQGGRICDRTMGKVIEGVYISPRFLSYTF